MSLPVPLTVRVGDQHITQQVQSLSFRKEAVGGVRSIAFGLARPLAELSGIDPLAKVYVYDGRSGATVAEGRLADTGRGTGDGGQRWDCVAFGPVQHASDITQPSVFIERSMSDGWRTTDVVHADQSVDVTTKPGDTSADPVRGILESFPEGVAVNTDSRITWIYDQLYVCTGQELGGFQFNWDASGTTASWQVEAVTGINAAPTDGFSATWNTAGGSMNKVYTTDFTGTGRNTLSLRIKWTGGAATTSSDTWGWFDSVVIRPRLKTQSGGDVTPSIHANSYILAHDVVYDLLGRLLPEYDGAGADVDTTATYQITHLAYRDGVTPEQILADLMGMVPSHRWYTTPDATGDGYGFTWETWPTTVRYEATLDDGGSFPLSAAQVYNQVWVRWVDEGGNPHVHSATLACPILDDQGLTRRAYLDLGSEAGSQDNASAAADAFLNEHNVPKNSGTLTVARPIRDVLTGALVQPWEIEAGELVRVLGVEAYPDAFNADTHDGQGVFRIHAVDYNSEGNVATLALDSDPRETEDALVKLLNQRARR